MQASICCMIKGCSVNIKRCIWKLYHKQLMPCSIQDNIPSFLESHKPCCARKPAARKAWYLTKKLASITRRRFLDQRPSFLPLLHHCSPLHNPLHPHHHNLGWRIYHHRPHLSVVSLSSVFGPPKASRQNSPSFTPHPS